MEEENLCSQYVELFYIEETMAPNSGVKIILLVRNFKNNENLKH